jgi:hypothetical protein
MDPVVVADNVELESVDSIQGVLTELFRFQYRAEVDAEDITLTTLAERTAAVHTYELGMSFDGVFIVVELEAGSYALFDLTGPAGGDDPTPLMETIIATLAQGDVATVQVIPVAVTVVPCLVHVEQGNTVPVRIGPGMNRAIMLYMPANIEVRANGHFVDPVDASEWFRILKSQIAPDVAAEELWIARTDVVEQGGCDTLTQIDARTVIPPAPPITAVRTTGGRASGGGSTPSVAADPNAQVGIVPLGGNWTFVYDSTAYQSCEGGDTTRMNTVEVLVGLNLRVTAGMDVAPDGRSLQFYGTTYTLQSGGVYLATAVYDAGSNAQTRLRPVSTAAMSGEFVINVFGDNYRCSITIPVSMRRG